MTRRSFLAATATTAALASAGLDKISAANNPSSAEEKTNGLRPVLTGRPVISGPAPDALSILQPLAGTATGFLEYSVNGGPFQRVDSENDGLMPFEQHVLKFRLPPLPPGNEVRYRVKARAITWVPVDQFVHGKIFSGELETGQDRTFRTLDPGAGETRFVVWNDTHENSETLRSLEKLTVAHRPDFLLWNGDQTNDLHFESDMCGQLLTPAGVELASAWPLAYVRGNHDTRGPAARKLHNFTGTPSDRFYYGFRSGPLAALVMDTGEDKPDDNPLYAGLAAFARLRERQTKWLAEVVREPWFREAPFRVLFCHIPLWWLRVHPGEYSKACREAWSPALIAAGVKLIISGHTHQYAWLPAGTNQAIGQLVGGGPRPPIATYIEGTATRERLTLTMQNLDGTIVEKIEIKA
jgi:predicted phosphodiesterase